MTKQGKLIMPTEIIQELLEIADIVDMQNAVFHSAPQEIQNVHNTKGTAPIWKRIKTLCPKAAGSLHQLRGPEGTILTSPQDLDQHVRSTRQFWTQQPAPLTQDLMDILSKYAEDAPPFPKLDIPSEEQILEAIHRTGNSAPGGDGIPYAMYRLIPRIAAKLARDFFRHRRW